MVSRGGNFLLDRSRCTWENSTHYAETVAANGGWLKINGEAFYETRKWKQAASGAACRRYGAIASASCIVQPYCNGHEILFLGTYPPVVKTFCKLRKN